MDFQIGSGLAALTEIGQEKIGKVTEKQIREIATEKIPNLNANSVQVEVKSIRGKARSMGIEVVA